MSRQESTGRGHIFRRRHIGIQGSFYTIACRVRSHVQRLRQQGRRVRRLAVDGTVILLHPPLPLVGVSIVMEREHQQNDSLANGYRRQPADQHPRARQAADHQRSLQLPADGDTGRKSTLPAEVAAAAAAA